MFYWSSKYSVNSPKELSRSLFVRCLGDNFPLFIIFRLDKKVSFYPHNIRQFILLHPNLYDEFLNECKIAYKEIFSQDFLNINFLPHIQNSIYEFLYMASYSTSNSLINNEVCFSWPFTNEPELSYLDPSLYEQANVFIKHFNIIKNNIHAYPNKNKSYLSYIDKIGTYDLEKLLVTIFDLRKHEPKTYWDLLYHWSFSFVVGPFSNYLFPINFDLVFNNPAGFQQENILSHVTLSNLERYYTRFAKDLYSKFMLSDEKL